MKNIKINEDIRELARTLNEVKAIWKLSKKEFVDICLKTLDEESDEIITKELAENLYEEIIKFKEIMHNRIANTTKYIKNELLRIEKELQVITKETNEHDFYLLKNREGFLIHDLEIIEKYNEDEEDLEECSRVLNRHNKDVELFERNTYIEVIDDEFLRLIKNTIEDNIKITLIDGSIIELNDDLKDIYNNKELTITNVSTFYKFLDNQIKVYKELISSRNLYSKDYLDTCKELNKEHAYLYSFISKYFKLEMHFGFYSVSMKGF